MLIKAKILWVQGSRATSPGFIPKLQQKGYLIETVPTGKMAVERIDGFDPDLAIVDSASLRTSGKRICRAIQNINNGLPIILILNADSPDPVGFDANVILKLPFTVRKLENRIVPLLPGGSDRVMRTGPIRLDLETRMVRCGDREAHLTPRLTRLLRMLMDHPGEVLERTLLFRRVWRTEYTGDTRTLDVHISWLRMAIEINPRHPKYLKTIRGIGYRLDI